MQLPKNIDSWFRVFTMLGAMIAFGWGVIQFVATYHAQAETRRVEATKPFLERQLMLYTEATQAASVLATSDDVEELDRALKKFWLLYWGELALVEDKRVEGAMKQMGDALKAGNKGKQLQRYSLALAHACRDSLAESWGVKQWRNPHSQIAVQQ